MTTTRTDNGWEFDDKGRPTEFLQTEVETREQHMWHITTTSNMAGPPCTITVTRQREKVTWARSRVCKFQAVIHSTRAKVKAAGAGALFAGAAFLIAAGIATGGVALAVGGTMLAAGGGYMWRSANEDIKVRKGRRDCPAFSGWTISGSAPIGSPIVQTQTVTCGRPITGGNRWIPIDGEEQPGTVNEDAPEVKIIDGDPIRVDVEGQEEDDN